ncbi:MAG: APC family permease [Planctomycetota bacterium]
MQEIEPPVPSTTRLRRFLFGEPRNLEDRGLAHQIALVPLLAWIGLGADGLSSSAYGPEEAYRALGEHTYLAIPLALVVTLMVFTLCACYSKIIEHFPQGGGGYVVSTALLGSTPGAISGCALLVDYVLTVTVSIAAAGSAMFSLVPSEWQYLRIPVEIGLIAMLVSLNIRGVRESVIVLAPIFLVFIVTHVVAIVGAIAGHLPAFPATLQHCADGFRSGWATLGLAGLLNTFIFAFSMGGGTYTGIEAVSNGLSIMREPRVKTAKRTMLYIGISLSFVAAGLLACYLLWDVTTNEAHKTLNAVLFEAISRNIPGGEYLVIVTLASEAALLVVAAQTGFLDGPRVLANMALDSWVPRRFAALSERLTTQNGIVLMGLASLAALLYTGGNVQHLVVMYSINVFVTFSLSLFGMTKLTLRERKRTFAWVRELLLFMIGFALCAVVLAITVFEKFLFGGWVTLVVTGGLLGVCFLVRSHYQAVAKALRQLDTDLVRLPRSSASAPKVDKGKPTAAILVSDYNGLGIHTTLNIVKAFHSAFENFVFLSIGLVDTRQFKGQFEVDPLRKRTEEMLQKYVSLVNASGMPATFRYAVGTDAVDEAEKLCLALSEEFPRATFFAGKIIFRRERWFERWLHNHTAFMIQRRLQWAGQTMVILPVRVR